MSRNKASSTQGLHRIAVFCLAFAVFLTNLPYRQVPTIDGAVRATLARNILTSGQWFPFTFHGSLFVDHPPLFVWLTALSMKFFGISDFAALLPMHLCSFLVLIVLYLIARELGASRGLGLLAMVILVTTRDFVLSSVRGYIEPLLELWIYLGFYFAVRILKFISRKSEGLRLGLKPSELPQYLLAMACAFCVALAWFSKGPPALWPTIFFPFLIFVVPKKKKFVMPALLTYFLTLGVCALSLAFVISSIPQVYDATLFYWKFQVLGSAVEGRNHAQELELTYFLSILKQYYWPWLPFLVLGVFLEFKPAGKGAEALPLKLVVPPLFIFLLGLGFVAGFSIVPWKFWYYIAPAYPAFSLFIALSVFRKIASVFDWRWFPRLIATGSVAFILAVSLFPIKLFKDRVPEITSFAPTVKNSDVPGPVWFLHEGLDHNLIGTSGEWSFWHRKYPDRQVLPILTHELFEWKGPENYTDNAPHPAWLITNEAHWQKLKPNCKLKWCTTAQLIQAYPQTKTVLIYIPNG